MLDGMSGGGGSGRGGRNRYHLTGLSARILERKWTKLFKSRHTFRSETFSDLITLEFRITRKAIFIELSVRQNQLHNWQYHHYTILP